MSMEVHVEQKHIKGSVPSSTTMCPIARALQEQYPGGLWCVWPDWVARWPGPGYRLPAKAEQFIRATLDGEEVAPFTFRLEMAEHNGA